LRQCQANTSSGGIAEKTGEGEGGVSGDFHFGRVIGGEAHRTAAIGPNRRCGGENLSGGGLHATHFCNRRAPDISFNSSASLRKVTQYTIGGIGAHGAFWRLSDQNPGLASGRSGAVERMR
jgi:hypothetical protein